MVASVIMS